MILSELKAFIIANPGCTKAELAKEFEISEDGIEAMLCIWVKKGKLKIKISQNKSCSSQVHFSWVSGEQISIRQI